jgi:hypothetical protein
MYTRDFYLSMQLNYLPFIAANKTKRMLSTVINFVTLDERVQRDNSSNVLRQKCSTAAAAL